ncbi:MAG: glycosyltransferase [Anaerolineae bacterium]|nr:glycosyltransferase [Anaerolineae bacterium]
MRLLFLTNFYPPADLGGWEQWCQEIANEFITRGHRLTVLTSCFGRDQLTASEPHVHRVLHLESDLNHYRPIEFFTKLPQRDALNREALVELVEKEQPDAAVIWGMWQLNHQLAVLTEELLQNRVAYYFCGFWPAPKLEQDPHTAYWRQNRYPLGWLALRRLSKTRDRRPSLSHAACVSRFVLDNYTAGGRPLPEGRVIYGGIDLDRYHPVEREWARRSGPSAELPLRLLFAGSLSRAKGVDTVLQAMTLLGLDGRPGRVKLSVVGTGHPDFVKSLNDYTVDNHLQEHVQFHDRIPKEEMAALLQAHDVLLFSSAWEEPLARMMMEGMASGMVLVSTTTGGSGEILQNDENCLTFQAGDAEGLASQIDRLLNEEGLAERLASAARSSAEARLDFQRMADEIEAFVGELL